MSIRNRYVKLLQSHFRAICPLTVSHLDDLRRINGEALVVALPINESVHRKI